MGDWICKRHGVRKSMAYQGSKWFEVSRAEGVGEVRRWGVSGDQRRCKVKKENGL